MSTPIIVRDSWDPLMSPSAPDLHWTTTNIGEAAPGVLTPLSWSVWDRTGDYVLRGSAFRMGVISRSELAVPTDPLRRYTGVFYGRAALQVQLIALLGDRMPGTTGQEAVASILGRVPPDMRFEPTARRYPVIAWRFPRAFATFPRELQTMVTGYERWWADSIERLPGMSHDEVRELFVFARRQFDEGVLLQTFCALGIVQPVFDALTRLIESSGRGDVGILSGNGGAEFAVVSDIWRASRDRLRITDVTARHGFHGPGEGELASRVWREDDRPLRGMIEQYARRDEAEDPARHDARRAAAWADMAADVVAGVPRAQRPSARFLLRLARRRIPMRGAAKRSFLQALDVLRAASRRLGADLAERGDLDEADDVFFLTADELERDEPADRRKLVTLRRDRHAEYRALDIPPHWSGVPAAVPRTAGSPTDDQVVRGVGVSPGVVEGRARVLLDPDFTDVEDDEILIAPTTDPSWSSIMFVSRALVVDIGGTLSHAAVVARELQIPCVVNTVDGTRRIRTGDLVRVDGTAGTVHVVQQESRITDERGGP